MHKMNQTASGNPSVESATVNVIDDWLAVSTEGFASMNAGRQPAHLVKELVQNSLDAVGDRPGRIELTAAPDPTVGTVTITCRDDGGGMSDPLEIRTVFLTSKTDTHLQRGRMGRGFKEMLCLAERAQVRSGDKAVLFAIEHGRRITRRLVNQEPIDGTVVEMIMPWGQEVIADLEAYFQTLVVPHQVRLIVNGQSIPPRPAAHRIDATLPTELFEGGRWVKPSRATTVELIPVRGDEMSTVYELGIPVCPVEWNAPYHANVLQRVPMNPCRDAVASGYLTKLHRICLPVLLPEMSGEQLRQDWVGAAAPGCDPNVQKEVIRSAFGENLARSVPKMGARQFDEDARDLGVAIIDTRHTSGGLRQILQQHVPTSRQVVDQHNQRLIDAAASGGFDLLDLEHGEAARIEARRRLIEEAGGAQHVQRVMDFARWFCQKLLEGYQDTAVCSVKVAQLKSVNALATWNQDDVLTLGLDTAWLWSDPLGEQSLATLIHEAARHQNAHHGRDFHQELETLAGRAARLMFINAAFIQSEYPTLLTPPLPPP